MPRLQCVEVKRNDAGLSVVVACVDEQLSHGMDGRHEVLFVLGICDRVDEVTAVGEDLEVTGVCHLEASVCHRVPRIL